MYEAITWDSPLSPFTAFTAAFYISAEHNPFVFTRLWGEVTDGGSTNRDLSAIEEKIYYHTTWLSPAEGACIVRNDYWRIPIVSFGSQNRDNCGTSPGVKIEAVAIVQRPPTQDDPLSLSS